MARRTKVERMVARFERRFGPDVSAEPATPAPTPTVVPFMPEPRPPALSVPLPVAALSAAAPTPEPSPEPWVSPERARRIEPDDLRQPVRPLFFTPTGLVCGPPQYVQWSGSKDDERARQKLQPHNAYGQPDSWAKDVPVQVMVPLPETPLRRIGRWLHERFR